VRGLRLGASGRRDDQPLTRLSAGVEAGWFATPRVPIVLHIEPMRFRRDAGDRDVWWSRVEVRRAGAGRGIEAAADLPRRHPAIKAVLFFHARDDRTVTYQAVDWTFTAEPEPAASIRAALDSWR
jgi:hypothetical protein